MSNASTTEKLIARKENGIGWVIFNNPEKRNANTPAAGILRCAQNDKQGSRLCQALSYSRPLELRRRLDEVACHLFDLRDQFIVGQFEVPKPRINV